MTKKKIMMAAMSAGLVAVVGIGGTLAYLSSRSETVSNTFSVGTGFIPGPNDQQAVWLDETDVDGNNVGNGKPLPNAGRDLANAYTDFNPGDIEVKDPIVYLTQGSVESYVFVRVTGVDELESIKVGDVAAFEVTGWDDTYWVKADGTTGKNGIYVANGGATVDFSNVDEESPEYGEYKELGRGDVAVPLFKNVEMESSLTSMPEKTDVEATDITVKACAVQYSEDAMPNDFSDALQAAKDAAGWN